MSRSGISVAAELVLSAYMKILECDYCEIYSDIYMYISYIIHHN